MIGRKGGGNKREKDRRKKQNRKTKKRPNPEGSKEEGEKQREEKRGGEEARRDKRQDYNHEQEQEREPTERQDRAQGVVASAERKHNVESASVTPSMIKQSMRMRSRKSKYWSGFVGDWVGSSFADVSVGKMVVHYF